MSNGKEVKRWWHLEASGDGDKDSVVVYGTKDDAKRDLANLLYFGSYEDAVQDDFVAAILSDFDDEENNWSRDGVWDHRGEQCYFRVSKIDRVENDRIMAERDELWKRATKFVMPGEMDTGESIEHYIKTLEQTIAELRAEVEKLRHDCGNHNISQADIDWCVLCDRKSNEATIATQARVIEELKASIGLAVSKLEEYHETYLDYDRPEMTAVPMEDDLLGIKHHLEGTLISDEELAAIEKEGAKDNE